MESIHSPKNRYSAEIRFAVASSTLGSGVSYTANDLTFLKKMAVDHARQAKCDTYVRIRENRANYPLFDWRDVAIYTLNAEGVEVATYPVPEPVNNTLEAIGDKLNWARRSKSITIAQLAAAVNVSDPTVGALLQGKGNVSLQTLVKVANFLDVQVL